MLCWRTTRHTWQLSRIRSWTSRKTPSRHIRIPGFRTNHPGTSEPCWRRKSTHHLYKRHRLSSPGCRCRRPYRCILRCANSFWQPSRRHPRKPCCRYHGICVFRRRVHLRHHSRSCTLYNRWYICTIRCVRRPRLWRCNDRDLQTCCQYVYKPEPPACIHILSCHCCM